MTQVGDNALSVLGHGIFQDIHACSLGSSVSSKVLQVRSATMMESCIIVCVGSSGFLSHWQN
jgi:hypothetical protein